MITFNVSPVEPITKPMSTLDRGAAIGSILHAEVLETSEGTAPLVRCDDIHSLAAAAHDAFYTHRPLVLSPDAVWFCIAQGFATHVKLHAEELRERFVSFQGKTKLVVERFDFDLGRKNPWPEVFAAFSSEIAKHVGKLRDLVVAEFSTTGPTERAAFEILLMDTFQPYFEYMLVGGCGIPSITLTGTPDDWRSLRRRVTMLSEFGLAHWTDVLLPVLDELVATSEGRVRQSFWRSFFRYESGSGFAQMTGWIQVLFPYLVRNELGSPPPEDRPRKTDDSYTAESIVVLSKAEAAARMAKLLKKTPVPSPYLAVWKQNFGGKKSEQEWLTGGDVDGPSIEELPSSMGSAPLTFADVRDGSKHRLRLVAGLFGVAQAPSTGALCPDFGWAVVSDPETQP